ncbi:rho-related GTP-binding protein RhoN [Crotalus adamanteus]|uniref:Rho-related GTP-binding protein RhoN n=2 Tax=Crotalus TaxID=8728 RepID=A0AAW1B3N3_CROAD
MNIVVIFSEIVCANLDESPAFLEPFSPRKREKQRAPPSDRDDEPPAAPGPRARRAESGVWHKEPESRGGSRALGLRRQESEGLIHSTAGTPAVMENQLARCKIVVVGDSQCGKTALLHVFAKDAYPENYVPTVFENYTASFEIEKQRIELNMWDTSGSTYYDNVRPLAYPDSDAVLICFDISRPETLDSVLKKWQGETQEFCPSAKVVLVGCKLDMRTDLNTLRELSKQRLIPVTHEQGSMLARQLGAVAYVECSSKVSENSVRDVFHVTTLASVNRIHKHLKRSNSKRGLKRITQMPGRTDLLTDSEIRKDRAKSCSVM